MGVAASAEWVPPELDQAIDEIVSAVRDGDEVRVRARLERFARRANIDAVFMLRQRLHQDLRE